MKNIIFICFLLLSTALHAQPEFSPMSVKPGAFSRMGFAARGMGMGNAVTAVIQGNLVSYYNPALAAFQEGNSFQASYSFLSLDRSLNFLNFTRKFEFGTVKNPNGEPGKPRSVAGLSIGVINSGVSGIEERDNQGLKTGEISTSENLIFLGLSNRFSEKFAVGLNVRFYYYKLYEDVTTTGLGFDLGIVYSFNENLTVAAVITDLNSKYEWDTTELYGQDGNNLENKLPVRKRIGLSYKFNDPRIIASVEFENSNAGTNYKRIGAEYNIYESLFLRGGIDKFDVGNSDVPMKPSFGFSYFHPLDSMLVGVDYAFVIEPYSPADQHIIGLNFNF